MTNNEFKQAVIIGKRLVVIMKDVDFERRAFFFHNYRPDLAKWATADPLGYPDGWNQLAYGPNSPLMGVDVEGARWVTKTFWYADEYTDFVVLTGGLPLDMPGKKCSTILPDRVLQLSQILLLKS